MCSGLVSGDALRGGGGFGAAGDAVGPDLADGSLGELEEILGRTMTDAGYMKLIAEAQDLFRDAPQDTLVYTM